MALAEVEAPVERRIGVHQEIPSRVGHVDLWLRATARGQHAQPSGQVDVDHDGAKHPTLGVDHGSRKTDGGAVRQLDLVVFPVEVDVRHEDPAGRQTHRLAQVRRVARALQALGRHHHHKALPPLHAQELLPLVGRTDETHLISLGGGVEVGGEHLFQAALPQGRGGRLLRIQTTILQSPHQAIDRRGVGEEQHAAPPLSVLALGVSGHRVHGGVKLQFGLAAQVRELLRVVVDHHQHQHQREAETGAHGKPAAQKGGQIHRLVAGPPDRGRLGAHRGPIRRISPAAASLSSGLLKKPRTQA
jgi:hypothetical protein